MKIANIGEDDFIIKINKIFSPLNPKDLYGIGDDCAVIPKSKNKSFLITTDTLIENVHFILKDISATDLGYKSLAVNLSDIAAMGGTPKYAFLSIALPINTDVSWLDKFLLGIHNIAKKYNVALLGGDTTRSPNEIFINISVIGEAHPNNIKYRSSAKVGDIICVTGNLGDSALGLNCIVKKITQSKEVKTLIKKHYLPKPHINEGKFLARLPDVHAIMDISDGIDVDLHRISKVSKCGIVIFLEQLPISKELKNISKQFKINPYEIAAIGGEDYCLALTINNKSFPEIAKKFQKQFSRPLVPIGIIIPPKYGFSYWLDGKKYKLTKSSFAHF